MAIHSEPLEILRLLVTRPRTAVAIIKFGAKGLEPASTAVKRGEIEEATRLFGSATLGPEFYRRLSESRLDQVRANFIQAELLGSGFAPLDADQVRSIQAPVLLVTGEQGQSFFLRLTETLQGLLPHSERVEIRDGSHLTHEDNAPVHNAAVLSFLTGHDRAA